MPAGLGRAVTAAYVEGQRIEPPVENLAMPSAPIPLGGVAVQEPVPEKTWRSDSAKIADAIKAARRNASVDAARSGA